MKSPTPEMSKWIKESIKRKRLRPAASAGSGASLTEEEILKAFQAAMPTLEQSNALTYETGPYDITKATGFLVRFAEQLTGKRLEVK